CQERKVKASGTLVVRTRSRGATRHQLMDRLPAGPDRRTAQRPARTEAALCIGGSRGAGADQPAPGNSAASGGGTIRRTLAARAVWLHPRQDGGPVPTRDAPEPSLQLAAESTLGPGRRLRKGVRKNGYSTIGPESHRLTHT